MTRSIILQGRRLIAHVDASLAEAAESTLRKLASLHAQGPPLSADSVVMFGWAPLRVVEKDGDWILHAPDFRETELRWAPDITSTLRVMDQQAAVVRALSASPRVARYDDFVLVQPGAERAPRVFLERDEPRLPHESGWFAGIDPADVEHEQPPATVPVSVLVNTNPEWLPFLALPPGFLVSLQNQQPVSIVGPDGSERLPLSG